MTYILKINGTDLSSYLKTYKVQRAKLYKDANRTMSGELKTTFIGIFPKILLEFRNTTDDEHSIILGLLDNSSFTVSWWDSKTQAYKSGTYYAGDFESDLFNVDTQRYNPFSVNLIPFKKLT